MKPPPAILCASSLVAFALLLAAGSRAVAQERADFELARKRMVDEVIVGSGIKSPRVVKSMLETPRHEFVSLDVRRLAYFDMSLPIGSQQTISSPFIVAYMTESLDPKPEDKVLEIGTGSGYQAAILSPLVKEVYTIEIVDALGTKAARTLARLGYKNVHVKVGDGFLGWPEHAPFDKIIVTCSPEKVPRPLIDQLREGGRMVIPVGERYQQTLYLLTKKEGQLVYESLRPTLFVPMTGRAESERKVQPDAANPQVVNGSFEEDAGDSPEIPGWYYQRQLSLVSDFKAPEGGKYAVFKNTDAGRAASALQGFAIDGRKVSQLELSAWVRAVNVIPGGDPDMLPMVVVSFYDADRREIGQIALGPWRGDSDWHETKRTLRVPPNAREGILRIGLFGATGEIAFDDVRMKAVSK
jgi:protein-L-isoaspartate(D-aspartate) O-methyltransferase